MVKTEPMSRLNLGVYHSCKVYWIGIEYTGNFPERIDLCWLEAGLKFSRYMLVPDEFRPIVPDKISQADKDKMERAYARIENLVHMEPDIYVAAKRKVLFKKIEEQLKIKASNLYPYLGKYWRGGMVKEALLPTGEKKDDRTKIDAKDSPKSFHYGPGEFYQIDTMIADCYLVETENRDKIAGRPVMFFVRDLWSQAVTGLYVTLENATCHGALLAFKNCAEEKVAFCQSFGIEIMPRDWPCHHLPKTLIGDNEELAGHDFDAVTAKLGIVVERKPTPYRGELKYALQTFLNGENIHLDYLVPGEEKDLGSSSNLDPQNHGCMDLRTFTCTIIRSILLYNKEWCMKKYVKDPWMRIYNIETIPLTLWNFGNRHENEALSVISKEEINQIFLPKD